MDRTEPPRLRTLLGDHPNTLALKKGEVCSDLLGFDFDDAKVAHTAFKRVVRDLEFDVAELAIMTFLLAKHWGKPLVLLPAVLMARFQHPYLVCNAERGRLTPRDLAGRRVGIRSYSVTTATWIRAILANDYGVAQDSIRWVSFEDAHVAEYREPPTVERAGAGKNALAMLFAGELDAVVVNDAALADPRLETVIPDAAAEARRWHERNRAIQINHMVVVSESLSKSNPIAVQEVFRLLQESKQAAPHAVPGGIDMHPYGLEANRRNLEAAIECAHRQGLIPRPFEVDELFSDVTRALGS
ncbi:MAG TPA: phosphate ABC transporter substrate-binding protein [Burkholderiales bacterium]|nr:phosphate ABC transporter substrate-binding protein [Burkholderiales bacterium]